MDDIIKRIIEIEDKAQSIVEEARKKCSGFDDFISQSASEMKKNMEEQTEDKIKHIEKIETEFMYTEIKELKQKNREDVEKINKIYEENKEQWILDAFNMIINEGTETF